MKKYMAPEAQTLAMAQEDILTVSTLGTLELAGIDTAENFGEFHRFGF